MELKEQAELLRKNERMFQEEKDKNARLEALVLEQAESANRVKITLQERKDQQTKLSEGSDYMLKQAQKKLELTQDITIILQGMIDTVLTDTDTTRLIEMFNTVLLPSINDLTPVLEELKKMIPTPVMETSLREQRMLKAAELRALGTPSTTTPEITKRKIGDVDKSPETVRKGVPIITTEPTSSHEIPTHKAMRLQLLDGSAVPIGFFGRNSPQVNKAINTMSAISYITALNKYYNTLKDMSGGQLQPAGHKYLISGVMQSWTKGYGLVEQANLKRPVALHICQVDNLRLCQNQTTFSNMLTFETFLEALEETFIGQETKYEALQAFQNFTCGPHETLSEFVTNYSQISSEYEMLTKNIMPDKDKRDAFCRALNRSPRHATTVQHMKATCPSFAKMISYVLDEAKEESSHHPTLSFNEVTKQIIRVDNTFPAPKTTGVLQSSRLGPRNSNLTKPNEHLFTKHTQNVLNFRAYKGRCTKCGSPHHFRYPGARGDGCPIPDSNTDFMNATDEDKAGPDGYKDGEPYKELWKAQKASKDEDRYRQRGTQQVASQSRLLQIGPSSQMQARLTNSKNGLAPG